MPHELLSPYYHRSSLIHRLEPTAKLVCAVLLIVGIVLLPRFAWGTYAIVGAVLAVICLLARLPAGALLRRMLVLEPFAIGIALLSLLQPRGLGIFLTMIAKSTLCLFTMVLLVATTRFSDVLGSLVRLRIPRLLVTVLALMSRYLLLLGDEFARIRRARRSRTFSQGRWSAWRSTSAVIAQLLIVTSERADRVYAAMCARGWRS